MGGFEEQQVGCLYIECGVLSHPLSLSVLLFTPRPPLSHFLLVLILGN